MTGASAAARVDRAGAPNRRAGRAAALPPDERRAAIVAAATPLLRQRGHDVTTREIAQAAGIAEGTVFRAFGSKRSIIDAVLADAGDLSGTVRLIRGIDRSAPLDERVRRCATILSDRLSTVIDLMIALRMHRPPQPPADRGARRAGRGQANRHRHATRHQHEMVTAIADLLAPDTDRLNCPPERAAHLLRLLSFAGTHRLINDGDPLTADEVADVLLYGIVRSPPEQTPDEPPDQRGLPPPAARR